MIQAVMTARFLIRNLSGVVRMPVAIETLLPMKMVEGLLRSGNRD
jgi:hypothetical protein